MKYLIALGTVLLLGLGGVVMFHQPGTGSARTPRADDGRAIAVLTRGDAIDIDAAVPRTGWTLVEFTADW